MFDIGFWELALIGILALVVLGPKRLPEAARAAGYWLGRIRNFIANARSELDQHMQGGDMEEIRRLKEELDETRRYIREVADQTGSDLSRSLEEIDPGFQSENSIGAIDNMLENETARTTRKRAGKKKKGKKTVRKGAKKVAGKSASRAKSNKTGRKKASKKSGKKKASKKSGKKKASKKSGKKKASKKSGKKKASKKSGRKNSV